MKYNQLDTKTMVVCIATGYPNPTITWITPEKIT